MLSPQKIGYREQLSTRPDQLFLVRGRDDRGQNAWYYIAVDRDKRDIFKASNGTRSLNLSDYGRTLHSGYGSEPPVAVQELMQLKYGFKPPK